MPFQYSGVYSPSRATSPHSENDEEDLAFGKKKPLPPSSEEEDFAKEKKPLPLTSSESTAGKAGKVLGSDQAKRRLQAFVRFCHRQGFVWRLWKLKMKTGVGQHQKEK